MSSGGERLTGPIKRHWLGSGYGYGYRYRYRKIIIDLRESGEYCSRHRVGGLMKAQGLRVQIGYGSRPRHRGGTPGMASSACINYIEMFYAPVRRHGAAGNLSPVELEKRYVLNRP